MSTAVTLTGRLTADPELRFLPSGKAVANFTVVTATRKQNQDTKAWEDSETTFWRCNVWDRQAENVVESLSKGVEVVVAGKAYTREYTTKEGEKRTSLEVQAYSVSPSLKWVTANIVKADRNGGTSRPAAGGADDPWATPAASGAASGGWSDEAPF